jgi:hypothetical protein
MSKLDFVLEELATANRILANEGNVDFRPCQRGQEIFAGWPPSSPSGWPRQGHQMVFI